MKLQSLTVIAAALVLVVACSKDSVTTRPQLKLKKISSDVVPVGGSLQITFDFSDKEGDLNQPLGIEKISNSPCPDAAYLDTMSIQFPDIPGTKNTDGELEVNLTPVWINAFRCNGSSLDTVEQAVFRFWIKDDAGNVSDTAVTSTITLLK
jgi:hypothetical protein